MKALLKKLENWLDKKLNNLDREHQFLQYSKKKWHRWLWEKIFKRKRNARDIIISSAPEPEVMGKPQKIIHIVNLISPHSLKNKDLAGRVALTLESIDRATRNNVILVGGVSTPIRRQGWEIVSLPRTAQSELNNPIDFAYLKDLLLAGSSLAKKDDIILYSNLDCPVHPAIYENLLRENKAITEFIRRDIPPPSQSCDGDTWDYEDVFSQPFTFYSIGVDAIAFKKHKLMEVINDLPDLLIGEPHWDTTVSGILNKSHKVSQNLEDLYHITHAQQWDDNNLTPGGEHNKKLYQDSVNYGLMEDQLISIKKDTALVVLKHNLHASTHNTIAKQLRQLSFLQGDVESIFCEYLEGESAFKKHINRISYLPIRASNPNTKKLNQKNCIINLLRHYFSDYNTIIITYESCPPLGRREIYLIQESLRTTPLISRSDYMALRPSRLEQKILDFYVENQTVDPNINAYSFINDDGLLELIDNYGYIQSPSLPYQGTKKQLGTKCPHK